MKNVIVLMVAYTPVMKSLVAKFLYLLQHYPELFGVFAQDVRCKIFPSSRARKKFNIYNNKKKHYCNSGY